MKFTNPLKADFPTVLFPIETLTRELDSKLVMASALAARGCRAVVGHKESIEAIGVNSNNVVWQGKSLFRSQRNDVADHLMRNGSAIMFIHDEGAIYQVKVWRDFLLKTHRVDYMRNRNVSRVCVWGKRQKEILSSYVEELKNRIAVTGSPRFDLCLPEYDWVIAGESDALREKYGSIILLCARFQWANHSEGRSNPFQKKMNRTLWAQELRQQDVANILFSTWQRDIHDFADFVILAKELAINFPQHTLVLRPHPSENLIFYRQTFAAFKNVVVTREGNVLPWIHAAKLVVHSNCTTGIEAVLLGRPVLNLLPENPGREEFDLEVAREAGHVVSSIDGAVQKAEDFLAGETSAQDWSPQARATLNNLVDAAIPKVAEETIRVIEECGLTSSEIVLPKTTKIRETIRRIVKGPDNSYAASKRGPLSVDHVTSIIDGYRERYGAGGKLRHVTKRYVVVDPA